jgi:ATP-binding cassette subfamily B protein
MMGRRLRLLASAAWEASPLLAFLAVVVLPAGQTFVALEALWMRNLINGALQADISAALIAAALLGASRGFEAFLLVPANYVQMTFGERMSIVVNRRIARLVATAPGLELHEDHETQDRLALIRDPSGFSSIVFRLAGGIGTILGFVATVGLLVAVHPALAGTPLLAVAGIVANRRGNKVTRQAQETAAVHERLARHYAGLATRPMWNKEIRVFGLAQLVRSRQREEVMTARDLRAGAASRAAIERMLASAITNAGLGAALVFVAILAEQGTRTPGDLVLAVLLLARLSRAVEELHNLIGASQEHMRTIDRYVWLDGRVREHVASFEGDGAPPPDAIRTGIRLEGVSFRYEGRTEAVLNDLDLTIPAITNPVQAESSWTRRISPALTRPPGVIV